jgi:hypothetical protein
VPSAPHEHDQHKSVDFIIAVVTAYIVWLIVFLLVIEQWLRHLTEWLFGVTIKREFVKFELSIHDETFTSSCSQRGAFGYSSDGETSPAHINSRAPRSLQ